MLGDADLRLLPMRTFEGRGHESVVVEYLPHGDGDDLAGVFSQHGAPRPVQVEDAVPGATIRGAEHRVKIDVLPTTASEVGEGMAAVIT